MKFDELKIILNRLFKEYVRKHIKRILIALDEAAKKGQGAASLDGRLIDAASAKMAENIVATDKAINSKK